MKTKNVLISNYTINCPINYHIYYSENKDSIIIADKNLSEIMANISINNDEVTVTTATNISYKVYRNRTIELIPNYWEE